MTSESVQPAPSRRRVRPGLVATGSVLGALGAAVVTVVTVLVVLAAGSVLRAPQQSPVDETVELDSGSYTVLLEDPDEGTIQLEAIEIVGPDGEPVDVGPVGDLDETMTIRSTEYEGVARFEAAVDGDYELRIETTPAGEVAVVRSLDDFLLSAAGAVVASVLGAVLLVVGIVLLVVGLVGRRTADGRGRGA